MIVSLVAAMAENRVIGREGRVPWHLPADLKHFKALTTGHTIVMGRKTFESVGRPLPNRRTVVLTRDPAYGADGVAVVHSLDDALALAQGEDEVFVVGGEQIYRLALPRADRVHLTLVHGVVEGDAHFPALDPAEWELVSEEHHPADERHRYPLTIRRYDRRRRR